MTHTPVQISLNFSALRRIQRLLVVCYLSFLGTAAAAPPLGSTNTTRDSVVVFNEIHYNPANDDSSLEYVELYNQLVVDVDISNWRIDGIGYDFPEGTVLGGQEYLVIAKNPAALASATGRSGALGPFPGTLSNSGETLRLYNNNRAFRSSGGSGITGAINESDVGRRVMDEISYSDTTPWPIGPDGSGSTLAKIAFTEGSAHPINWTASTGANGTPGFANTFTSVPDIAFNEASAGNLDSFQLELFNGGTSTVTLGGMVIASSDPLRAEYTFTSGSIAAGGFTTIDETTLGYAPVDNERLFLTTRGRTALVDAVRIDDRAQARSPDGTGPGSALTLPHSARSILSP